MAPKNAPKADPKPPSGLGEEDFPEVEEAPAVGAPASEEDVDLNTDVDEEDLAAAAPPPPAPPVEEPVPSRVVGKPRRRGALPQPPAPIVVPETESPLALENRLLREELAKVNHRLRMAEKRAKGQGGLMEFSNHTPESARKARAEKRGHPGRYKTLKDIKDGAREHSRRQSASQQRVGKFIKDLAAAAAKG